MPTSPSWRGLPFFLTQSRRPALNDVHTREMGGGRQTPTAMPGYQWRNGNLCLLHCSSVAPALRHCISRSCSSIWAQRLLHGMHQTAGKKSAWEEMRPHCIAATKILGRGHCWDEKKEGAQTFHCVCCEACSGGRCTGESPHLPGGVAGAAVQNCASIHLQPRHCSKWRGKHRIHQHGSRSWERGLHCSASLHGAQAHAPQWRASRQPCATSPSISRATSPTEALY